MVNICNYFKNIAFQKYFMSTKSISLFLVLLCVTIFSSHSQIITSKKEALKKGLYQKPADVKKEITTPKVEFSKIENPAEQLVIKENKPKETKSYKTITVKKAVINDQDDDDLLFTPAQNYLATQLINNAMQFVGVRYRTGGTSLSGMDCSGFVTAAFNIFDLKLPRTSIDMSHVGEKIDPLEAKKGDLIFFRTHGGVINHVGMVVEVINDEIKFLHASSSKGVMMSSTKENYYKRAFAQVNKVLKN